MEEYCIDSAKNRQKKVGNDWKRTLKDWDGLMTRTYSYDVEELRSDNNTGTGEDVIHSHRLVADYCREDLHEDHAVCDENLRKEVIYQVVNGI